MSTPSFPHVAAEAVAARSQKQELAEKRRR